MSLSLGYVQITGVDVSKPDRLIQSRCVLPQTFRNTKKKGEEQRSTAHKSVNYTAPLFPFFQEANKNNQADFVVKDVTIEDEK